MSDSGSLKAWLRECTIPLHYTLLFSSLLSPVVGTVWRELNLAQGWLEKMVRMRSHELGGGFLTYMQWVYALGLRRFNLARVSSRWADKPVRTWEFHKSSRKIPLLRGADVTQRRKEYFQRVDDWGYQSRWYMPITGAAIGLVIPWIAGDQLHIRDKFLQDPMIKNLYLFGLHVTCTVAGGLAALGAHETGLSFATRFTWRAGFLAVYMGVPLLIDLALVTAQIFGISPHNPRFNPFSEEKQDDPFRMKRVAPSGEAS